MEDNLFSEPPQYTIDSSSLMDIFGDEKMVSKNVTPGLWENIIILINNGIIISHIEVLQEIKKDSTKGEELYSWAHKTRNFFKDYNWTAEGRVIRAMSTKYANFVNAKTNHIHADPWLVAQAKHRGIKLITEETFSNSSDVKKHRLPNICADPVFNVGCINLLNLIKEQNWQFH